jgi:AbrB family looped-hinge helix DNA binding protein
MKRVVGERGQITIPKVLRDRLGIRPGIELEVREEAGKIVLAKRGVEEAIQRWRGSADTPAGSTDELLERLRDEE